MSRSVLRDGLAGFRVSLGTVLIRRKGFLQNVQGRILIPVQYHTASVTDVRTNTEAFLDDGGANGAFLTGIVRRNCNDFDIMQERISDKPLQEDAPTSIMNALR